MATTLETWRCTKCGRITRASQKPDTGNTSYGYCPKAANKKHNWVRK